MGSNKSLRLIVFVAAVFLSACGSAEFNQLPYRSADGTGSEAEGTFTGSIINNDPNKVFVSYNGQDEMPKIKMSDLGILKCSLRSDAADIQLNGAYFTIHWGDQSRVISQDELLYSDLAILGGNSFLVSCAGQILNSNGATEWVVSNTVEVLLFGAFATTDSLDDSQPTGPKISLPLNKWKEERPEH